LKQAQTALLNALKAGSQDTYLSHFIQYVYWCQDMLYSAWRFPTPYTQVAAFLVDKVEEGIQASTIRGYKSAIKWVNDLVGTDEQGSGWNSKYWLLSRISQYAALKSPESHISKALLPLKKSHMTWLWGKFIESYTFTDRVAVLSYTCAIFLAARASEIWKSYGKNSKGLRFEDINIIWRDLHVQEHHTMAYGLFPPSKLYPEIKGLRFRFVDIKTGTENQYIYKYIGRSGNVFMDPAIEVLKYLTLFKDSPMFRGFPSNYLFSDWYGRPLTANFMRTWVKQWRNDLPGYSDAQTKRILLHTCRKTFCNLLYQCGWDMIKIGAYGNWAVPNSIGHYYCPSEEVALTICELITSIQVSKERENWFYDMDVFAPKPVL